MEDVANRNSIIDISIDDIPKTSLRILFSLILLVFIPFFFFHGSELREEIRVLGNLLDVSFFSFLFRMVWVSTGFVIITIVGIIIHEAIHAVFFSLFLRSKFQGVKFGFNKEHGIPYVHILEPISVLGFRIGAIMPLVILGIFPAVLGLYSGSFALTVFGALFIISASGDLLLISKTWGLSKDTKVKDLSDKIGFEVL